MQVFVLTYHSTNVYGNTYQSNDLIAFKNDLDLFKDLNVEIISTYKLIEWMKGLSKLDPNKKYVVLTFDDGCELDFYDWEHPTHGFQQSFYSSMKAYDKEIHATSFVIASKEVRTVLADTCTAGYEIWGDKWWQEAENTGCIGIENHSWDHLHTTLSTVKQQDNIKGDFTKVVSFSDANAQIEDASNYINSQIIKKKVSLFAYPYGHYNDYLTQIYFQNEQDEMLAAFTCDANPVTQDANLWKIPRFVCGLDWKTSSDLKNILT